MSKGMDALLFRHQSESGPIRNMKAIIQIDRQWSDNIQTIIRFPFDLSFQKSQSATRKVLSLTFSSHPRTLDDSYLNDSLVECRVRTGAERNNHEKSDVNQRTYTCNRNICHVWVWWQRGFESVHGGDDNGGCRI